MNKIIEKARENWIYILALFLILLFVWIYSGQNNVLVESDNQEDGVITQESKNVKEDELEKEEVKGSTTKETKSVKKPIINEVKTKEEEKKVFEIKEKVKLEIIGQGEYSVNIVEGDTGFDVLLRAATTNGFKVGYQTYSFGRMVTQIGDVKTEGTNFWALYYNGESSMVGADDLIVKDGDNIKWGYESWE